MDTTKTIAALFDFDGVIMDTETQYTVFWDEQGRKYLNEQDFGRRIKGQTLTQIYDKYFSDQPEAQQEITAGLNVFEKSMSYEYISGVEAFIANLRNHGVKTVSFSVWKYSVLLLKTLMCSKTPSTVCKPE